LRNISPRIFVTDKQLAFNSLLQLNPVDGHFLWVKQAVVPIPAALWLFGSG
jgi:hypothetical protein